MVEIFRRTPREPSANERFAEEIGRNLGAGITQHFANKKAAELRGQENEFLKKEHGIDITGIETPDIREQFVKVALSRPTRGELEDKENTYNSLKGVFGPTFAE